MNGLKEKITLKKVVHTDVSLLFDWANDPEVRKWSFKKKLIKLEDHKIWFNRKLNNPDVLMWIFEENNSPSGIVRLEKEDNKVLLNYMIAPGSRGKGLGSRMLEMAINAVKSHWQHIKIFAYTFPDNIASIKSLEKTGFYFVSTNNEKNCYIYETDKN